MTKQELLDEIKKLKEEVWNLREMSHRISNQGRVDAYSVVYNKLTELLRNEK